MPNMSSNPTITIANKAVPSFLGTTDLPISPESPIGLIREQRAAEAELSIKKLELSVKSIANEELISQLKLKTRDFEGQSKELNSLRRLPEEIRRINSEWGRLREEDSSHYARVTERHLTEESRSRLKIADLEAKVKAFQSHLAEKDQEILSGKARLGESVQAQQNAISSRDEAVKAQDEAIKGREEATQTLKETSTARNEISKAGEKALKDFHKLRQEYDELWQRSYAVIKEKNDTISDVKATTKRKNNEVLIRMSTGENTSKEDEEWIQSHRPKCEEQISGSSEATRGSLISSISKGLRPSDDTVVVQQPTAPAKRSLNSPSIPSNANKRSRTAALVAKSEKSNSIISNQF